MEPPQRTRGAQRPAEPGAEAAALLTTPQPLSRRYLHKCGWLRVGKTLSSAQCGIEMLRGGRCGGWCRAAHGRYSALSSLSPSSSHSYLSSRHLQRPRHMG